MKNLILLSLIFISSILTAQTPGSIDMMFNSMDNGLGVMGSNNQIHEIGIDLNGNVLLAGEHTLYNGQQTHGIVRVNPNGEIDINFQTSVGINGSLDAVCVQPDGKILIGGAFTLFDQTTISRIARLNIDGTLDTTFHSGQIIGGGGVREIKIQTDGKIIIGGGFYCSTYSANSLLRLQSNGTIDSSFTVGTGFNNSVNNIHILPNGKIFVSGIFTQYNGSTANKIARLNSDGTIDNSFNQVYNFQNEVDFSAIQPDNKILLSGYGMNPNNPNQTAKLVRLEPNGQLDTIWYFQGGAVQSVFTQPDGKIFRIGSYINQNSSNDYGVFRLLNNGSVDPTFTPNSITGTGSSLGTVNCFSEINNGAVIIGGTFTSVNGIGKTRVARMYICSSVNTNEEISSCDFYISPSGDTLTQSGVYIDTLTTMLGCDSIITLNLSILNQPTLIENMFSLPSAPNNCVGEFAVDLSGNGDFELDVDNGAQTATSSGYSLFTGLCPGVHDLQIVNSCGDTTTTQFVIPVDSNYVFNNPFIDSLAVDSLGTTIEDCDIYYAGIDTAYIDSIWTNGNTVNVIWNIVDSNGSNFDTTSYMLNNGNGVYWLQLSVFCPTKALGDYFTVTEAIYLEGLTVVGLNQEMSNTIVLYPNPTNDLVTITFDGSLAELTVYDTQGKLIQTSSIVSGTQVSLKDVETGIYFFELSNESGRVVKRVVKN